MLRTVVLGATGFVGRALVLGLHGRGHHVTALARSTGRARNLLPAGTEIAELSDDGAVREAVASADAVINLAGESIAARRWTKRRKQVLVGSRIGATGRLVDAISARERPLPVMVSASATGYYGDRGDEMLDEQSGPGTGFAAALCREWEAAARQVEAQRVVLARFGIVLGRDGGAMQPLLKIARLGIGGPLGDGSQWVSWIHLDDLISALLLVVEDARFDGPVVMTAPNPVPQRELAKTLGKAVHRPAGLRAPRFAVKLALGEAATMVLGSQRVLPRALVAAGFRHRFPTLASAVADLLDDGVDIERTRPAELTDAAYLKARRPRYTLRTRTELEAPLAEVFPFFSAPENLAALTPPQLAFAITATPGRIANDSIIDYTIRVAGVPMTWRTRIERWQPGELFVDSQERGPYRSWWHEHRFFERDGKTIMEDTVHYAPPLGPLGAIANRLFIARMIRGIFGYRRDAIRMRFGNGRVTHA